MRGTVFLKAALMVCAATGAAGAADSGEAVRRPNIVFILADDLGKEWIGCYGAGWIETPNLDQLAATGARFSNAYSMPQCTPSRVCFLTGQYPYRNGWVNHWDVPRWGVGYFDWDSNPSIGRVMKDAGYRTAAAGKWQLNDFRVHPHAMREHGFDEYCMWTGGETDPADENHIRISGRRYWDPYLHTQDGSRTHHGEFGPDLFNRFLLDFISDNRDDPFFIYYPMVLPHTPFVATPREPEAETNYGKHKAMVRCIDDLVGRLVIHLEETGLSERTLIIFTSDNGTTGWITNTMNGRTVKGGKMKLMESGVNAPFIVNWPGHVPAGVESDALLDFSDLLPTFAEFAGARLEPGYAYDGISMKPTFLDPAGNPGREWILAMGAHPGVATEVGIRNVHRFGDRVLRGKRFKLYVGTDGQPHKLVDLRGDPAEDRNLIDFPEYAEEAARLNTVLERLPKIDQNPRYRQVDGYPVYPQ